MRVEQDVFIPRVAARFEPGGWSALVSSISIVLEANGIPRIFLRIDPAHKWGGPVTTATLTSLGQMQKWLDKAQNLAANPDARGSVDIKVTSPGGGFPQIVRLNDWLVVAAGLVDLTATGQFSLEVELQHPVGKLDRSPASLGNISAEPAWGDGTSYTNPVQGLAQAYRAWAKTPRVSPQQQTNDCAGTGVGAADLTLLIESARNILTAKADEFEQLLKWQPSWPENDAGYSDMPFVDSCFSACRRALGMSLTPYASGLAESSIWSGFVGDFSMEWQLATIPTYWMDSLQVMPMSPWAKPCITVYDDEISAISFPGVDPAPIGGTRIAFTPTQEALDQSGFPQTQEQATQSIPVEVLYLPPVSQGGERPIGRILSLQAPSWVLGTAKLYGSEAGQKMEPEKAEGDSSLVSTENIDAEPPAPPSGGGQDWLKAAGIFAGALQGVARQLFMTTYRGQLDASFATPLRILSASSSWTDGFVVPGCVVEVKTRQGGNVLFVMYLTSVTHSLDCDSNQASSMWSGTYCRPSTGVKDVINPGTYNPMYK